MDKISLADILKHRISKYRFAIIIVLIIFLLFSLIISAKMLEITENPAFCGKNCHIMRPYYDSWSTSSHTGVKCVECHYEPGVIGHIKGKINGLMQFYNYETTVEEYSGNLYAKVMDKNCLICHKDRVFSNNVSFTGINFSHNDHLEKPLRGIGLTCTSCHSMLVIGMKEHQSLSDPSCGKCHPDIEQKEKGHIVVTTSTCFTCHFRDIPGNTSVSGCPSCHGAPKENPRNYTNFNHSSHLGRGAACLTCHINISKGANDIVPKDKCISCHYKPDRLVKYDNVNFVHDNHVTNNKIACYNCHSDVKHSPLIKENLCANCHKGDHPDDWLITHKSQVLSGKVCSNCHQPEFCSDCHATGKATRISK